MEITASFKSNQLIKSHPQYAKKCEEVLLGIFTVGATSGINKESNSNPFKDNKSIEFLVFQCGFESLFGKISLPNIDDIKWLDIVHLRTHFNSLISEKCIIIRPNAKCLLFIGDTSIIKSVSNMFQLYYSDDVPHFLNIQWPTPTQPFAMATLSFNVT